MVTAALTIAPHFVAAHAARTTRNPARNTNFTMPREWRCAPHRCTALGVAGAQP